MKTMVVLLVILITSCCRLVGQDSLLKANVNPYSIAAQKAARSGNFEEALGYADSLYILNRRLKNIHGVLISKSIRGKIYQAMGKSEEAYLSLQQALVLVDSIPDEDINENFTRNNARANMYKDLIKLFHRQGLLDSMSTYCDKISALPCEVGTVWAKDYVVTLLREQRNFKKALGVCQEILSCYSIDPKNKYLLPKILLSTSIVYSELGQHETAIAYIDSTLQIAEEEKDSFSIMHSYEQLAIEFSGMSNNEEALRWQLKCVQIAEKLPRYIHLHRVSTVTVRVPLGHLYGDLSVAYNNVNKVDSAKYYALKALEVSYELRRYDHVANKLVDLAKFMVEDGDNYQGALDSLDKAYRIAPRYRSFLRLELDIYLTKGEIYTALTKIDSALFYYKKAEEVAKELGIDNRLAATYRRIEAFYKDQKDYEKAYGYQTLKVEQESKMKDRERQNAVLNFEIKYDSEKLKQENLLLAETQKLQAKELSLKEALNQRNNYIILGLIVLILLLMGIAWLVYRQKNLQTQFKIMSLEQKALKAQINPHFFFNILNSLQGTILSKEPMVAYRYHTKFTKLMRLILVQSDSNGITLKEELEALRLYLELEQLRTNTAFEFEIINNVDLAEDLTVPSMLLQPFVENSIWHGVMNRAAGEDKKIIIHINRSNNCIVCGIEDTGVGRKQAQLIQQKKTKTHESMGMKVTQNRLELFQLRYKTPLMFSIEDLKGMKNQILGTKVNLEIPIIK